MKAIVMNGTGGREMLEHVERPDPVVDQTFSGCTRSAATLQCQWRLAQLGFSRAHDGKVARIPCATDSAGAR